MNKILKKTIIYRIITIAVDSFFAFLFGLNIFEAISLAFLIEVILHSTIYYLFEKNWHYHDSP